MINTAAQTIATNATKITPSTAMPSVLATMTTTSMGVAVLGVVMEVAKVVLVVMAVGNTSVIIIIAHNKVVKIITNKEFLLPVVEIGCSGSSSNKV